MYSRRLVADGAEPVGVVVAAAAAAGMRLLLQMMIVMVMQLEIVATTTDAAAAFARRGTVLTTRFTHPLATRLAQSAPVDDPPQTRPTPGAASAV